MGSLFSTDQQVVSTSQHMQQYIEEEGCWPATVYVHYAEDRHPIIR